MCIIQTYNVCIYFALQNCLVYLRHGFIGQELTVITLFGQFDDYVQVVS